MVLITLDAARADRLGSYGGGVRTPHLDALGRDGVRFEQAYTPAPLCLPAHASILTGRWPRNHGVRTRRRTSPGGGATAAELFKRAGYRTAAVVASTCWTGAAASRAASTSTWTTSTSLASVPAAASARAPSRSWTARWAGWRVGRARPVFLWVHLSDAKAPHSPPADLAREYEGRPYDGEIAALDRAVGRLRAKVRGGAPADASWP